MNNNFEKFLLDENLNDKVFEGKYKKFKIHKEKFNDRFVVIYLKEASDYLYQEEYKASGYLDIHDKCIYDCDYYLNDLLSESKTFKLESFYNLKNKINEDVCVYLANYSFKKEKELMENSLDLFEKIDEWKKERYMNEIRKNFIKESNPFIKLELPYSLFSVINSYDYSIYRVYVEYLNNPEDTIKKYANKIINLENFKTDLGLQLLIYYDKVKYLENIVNNYNNEFKDLYVNKNIYDAIKNLDAKTLNITIKYGGKSLTFKYEYRRLIDDLVNDNRGSSDYGVGYDKVSEFIKENNKFSEYNRKEDFDFANISSITYGKKELYHCNNINEFKTKKEQFQEDIEIEI